MLLLDRGGDRVTESENDWALIIGLLRHYSLMLRTHPMKGSSLLYSNQMTKPKHTAGETKLTRGPFLNPRTPIGSIQFSSVKKV